MPNIEVQVTGLSTMTSGWLTAFSLRKSLGEIRRHDRLH
jgi:hypothetical protein